MVGLQSAYNRGTVPCNRCVVQYEPWSFPCCLGLLPCPAMTDVAPHEKAERPHKIGCGMEFMKHSENQITKWISSRCLEESAIS